MSVIMINVRATRSDISFEGGEADSVDRQKEWHHAFRRVIDLDPSLWGESRREHKGFSRPLDEILFGREDLVLARRVGGQAWKLNEANVAELAARHEHKYDSLGQAEANLAELIECAKTACDAAIEAADRAVEALDRAARAGAA